MKTQAELKTIKAVYAYYFPEVRKVIGAIVKNYPHNIFLQSINPGLDNFEKPIISKLIEFYKDDVHGFELFPYVYPTSGSSEAIYHTLYYLKNNYPNMPIYTLEGDYEGYRESGAGLGIHVQEIPEDIELIKKLPLGFWFISNPSARNGNILSDKLLKEILALGHKVIYDLSYVGMSPRHLFDISHPNVFAVLTSLSKPFGLFYYRIGFAFFRTEIKSLYGTKWFKNIFSLIIADKIFSTFTSHYLFDKYSNLQPQILKSIKKDIGITLKPSDVPLLAYLTDADFLQLSEEQKSIVEKYKRKNWYRFCLTQYYLDRE